MIQSEELLNFHRNIYLVLLALTKKTVQQFIFYKALIHSELHLTVETINFTRVPGLKSLIFQMKKQV